MIKFIVSSENFNQLYSFNLMWTKLFISKEKKKEQKLKQGKGK